MKSGFPLPDRLPLHKIQQFLMILCIIPMLYDSVLKSALEIVEKKKKSLKSSLEASIVKVLTVLLENDWNKAISFPDIWEGLKLQLQAVEKEDKLVLKNGKEITKKLLGLRLRDALAGEKVSIHLKKTTTSAYRFDKEKIVKLAKKYDVSLPASSSPMLEVEFEKNEGVKLEVVDLDESSDEVD